MNNSKLYPFLVSDISDQTQRIKNGCYFLSKCMLLLAWAVSVGFANENKTEEDAGPTGRGIIKWEAVLTRRLPPENISPLQLEALKDHRNTHQKMVGMLLKQIVEKRRELYAELLNAEFNGEKVKSLHAEYKILKNLLDDEKLQGILKIREILTPEQFDGFLNVKKDVAKGEFHSE